MPDRLGAGWQRAGGHVVERDGVQQRQVQGVGGVAELLGADGIVGLPQQLNYRHEPRAAVPGFCRSREPGGDGDQRGGVPGGHFAGDGPGDSG